MKKLLICPKCEADSRTEVFKWVGKGFGIEVRRIPFVLGEITDSGDLKIKRAHKGFTIITGDNFTVRCARCGEPAYRKEVINGALEVSSFRFKWFSGGSIIPETQQAGGSLTA